MSVLVVIPARGGSKRIPRKNIKEFCGKPIIQYSIEAAVAAKIFDEVMVSTDDDEIAKIAKKSGAKVPFMRSAKTSDDYATTPDVLREVITEYKVLGREFDYVCCVYPCSPFISAQRLKEAMELIVREGADSLMPVCRFSVPVEWALKINGGLIEPKDTAALSIRSQDIEPSYFDVGQFYIVKTECIVEHNSLLGEKNLPLILPEIEVQDIDSEEDWVMAEVKYNLLRKE